MEQCSGCTRRLSSLINLAVVSIWVNSAMESKGHDNAREEKVIPKQSFHILIFVL